MNASSDECVSELNLIGLGHFAVHVKDLQRSAAWYERMLGFRVLHRWKTTWMIGRGNIKVGLFLRPDAAPIPDPEKAIIIQHVAFLIDGDKFAAARQALLAAGVEVAGPEDSGIAYSIFFNDPDGHELEITTYHAVEVEPAPREG